MARKQQQVDPSRDANTWSGIQNAQGRQTRTRMVEVVEEDLVRVRALRRGFYGPQVDVDEVDVNSPTGRQTGWQSVALIRNEGEVFDWDTSQMERVDEEAMSKPRVGPSGKPMPPRKEILMQSGLWGRFVITETGTYVLPSWVELVDDAVTAQKGHKTKHMREDVTSKATGG